MTMTRFHHSNFRRRRYELDDRSLLEGARLDLAPPVRSETTMNTDAQVELGRPSRQDPPAETPNLAWRRAQTVLALPYTLRPFFT